MNLTDVQRSSCFTARVAVSWTIGLIVTTAGSLPLCPTTAWAQPPQDITETTTVKRGDNAAVSDMGESAESKEVVKAPELPIAAHWRRLSEKGNVWIDPKNKTAIVGGTVCHRAGPLEMFACPKHTKEYESVVAVDCEAFLVHTALLAIGAEPGSPVVFQPEYKAATGPTVTIRVNWQEKDENGEWQQKSARAQDWVKHVPTGNAMQQEWVFAGSGFWKDDRDGKEYYFAEGGELICVSNFSTATLDLPVKSSQGNADLQFAAFEENIPPLGTAVHLVLQIKK